MSASLEAQETASFTVLTKWLVAAARDKGPISIPDNILALFKSNIIDNDNGIRDFIKIFGSPDHTARLRLDHAAFMNVIAILLHLPYSHYQEKLLFTFMTTIELLKDVRATQAILKRIKHIPLTAHEIDTKRRKISNKLIQKMIRVLVLNEQETSMRLMAAHILFALLHDCAEAQELVQKQPEIVKLGLLVDGDDDYILRLFTANLVRELCLTTSELHKFWPRMGGEMKNNKYEDFPLSPAPDSQWVKGMADYLSSKYVNRGFRGDNHPFVCGLLSIDTGSHIFKDEVGANILAVLAEKFVFVIPSTPRTPLTLLEFLLDAHCECSIDEETSPDFRPEIGRGVIVLVETDGRGYQLFRGARNALDTAKLVFSEFEQGEAFAKFASRSLQSLHPPLQLDDDSAYTNIPSRTESHSFRRLDVGMIDMSTNSDAEDGAASMSDDNSISKAIGLVHGKKMSGSRLGQSSRMTEAKLKEIHRNKRTEPAGFPPQGSLAIGEQGELAAHPQLIDLRMLELPKSDRVQVGVDAGLTLKVDFATYVDQTSHDNLHTSQERGRNNTKPLFPHEHLGAPRGSTLPPEHLESSPSNRVHRQTSKRPVAEVFSPSNRLPPQQSIQPVRSIVHGSASKQHSGHGSQPPPCSRKAELEFSKNAVNKMSVATDATSDTAPNKMQILKRPPKSQPSTIHSIEWDVGSIGDEHAALPATKKLRLREQASRNIRRQSPLSASFNEDSIHSMDSGAGSVLKRPKVFEKKSQVPQQKISTAKQDDFDLEDENEPVAPASEATKAATKRATMAASNKTESRVSKTSKAVLAKPATKGRKALQPIESNTISLASARARRGRLKPKTYIDDSDSNPNTEHSDGEAQEVRQKTTKKALGHTKNLAATVDAKEAMISAHVIHGDHSGETKSNHEVSIAPLMPAQNFTQTTEVATAHLTLVKASPVRLTRKITQLVGDKGDDALDRVSAGKGMAQAQEPSADAEAANSPDQIAEDSYPMAATKIHGPRVSFGIKLGQMVQNNMPNEMMASTVAAHTTLLSDVKSFVDSVNKTRSASPKKKPGKAITSKDLKAETIKLRQLSGTCRKEMETSIDGRGTTPMVTKETQGAAPSSHKAKVTPMAYKIDSSTGEVAQQKGAKDLSAADSKELRNEHEAIVSTRSTSPGKVALLKMPYFRPQKAGREGPESRQRDDRNILEFKQSHMTRRVIEPKDINATIDLTKDSDEVVSVTGHDRVDLVQDSLKGLDEPAGANALLTRDESTDDTRLNCQGEQAIMQSNRTMRSKLRTDARTSSAKTAQSTKIATAARSIQRSKLTLSKGKTRSFVENATKKAQLVHFGKHGPQNQGIPSPDKGSRKTIASTVPPPETQTQQAYKQRHSIAAVPNSFVAAPRLRADISNFVGEGDTDDQGILVEDDVNMEDICESAQDDCGNAISEESAPFPARHLPPETFKMGKNGSQSSRIDQNGSPRLQPQNLFNPADLAASDMDMTSNVANDHLSLGEEDIMTTTKEPASAISASQSSDPSIHLTHETPEPHRSDRSTHMRSQAATALALSSAKLVKKAERRFPIAAMSITNGRRESLGLSNIVQEQYPDAQRNLTRSPLKKPTLRTTVSKTLAVSPLVFRVGRKTQVKTSEDHRQPLKEISMNNKTPAVVLQTLLTGGSELSSASSVQVTKPPSGLPMRPCPTSDALGSTPPPLKAMLLRKQLDKNIKKEKTILENLNRSKSIHQHTEDADRTLVEGMDQYYRRRPSEVSCVDSTSSSPETEHGKYKKLHRRGSQDARTNVRDALLEITGNILFRLESEEKAIQDRLNDYNSGCNNILKQFQDTNTKLFQRAGVALLKKATGITGKLDATFDGLQTRKINVRNADTKDQTQRAVTVRQNTLADRVEQMLEAGGTSKVEKQV